MAKIKTAVSGTKKEAILVQAAVLFRKKGYRAASVRELAESLGIEAPSLYNHIGSKAELLREICFGVGKDFTANMQAVTASKKNAMEKTAAVIRFHVRKMYASPEEVFVADNEWKQMDKADAAQYLAQRRDYENTFSAIIGEGIKKKLFRKMNARITMLTILSALRGLEFRHRNKYDFGVEELEENMTAHLLNGISK